jgi:hypothetical protein
MGQKGDSFSTSGDCPGPDQELDRQITPKQHEGCGQAFLLPGPVVFGGVGPWFDGVLARMRGGQRWLRV